MNQAFGGAFLIKIALIFLSIYIVVLGFAMNYAKVFTMKNRIISLIEKYEGYDENNSNSPFMVNLRDEINKLNYAGASTGLVTPCDNNSNQNLYCIREITSGNSTYYIVTTYIQFKIPLLSSVAAGVIPVTGETRYLYNF